MKTIPRIVMATVLAIPVFFGLSLIDPLARWVGSAQAWDLLAPLFQLLGANGIETEEDVLMGVLFVASFVIALLIIWMASRLLRRTRKAA
ncbi:MULTISPECIES: hypothetical protein [unclassified Burkholderia]|uniref:hypothetical protein n=1 Tax=unclassified Burkholderia TaxID=2613784 RepID=UPI00141FCEA2|nr:MULTISPECIES: hypothetical protein [unclassified Burkholderia]NIE84747.1 hypothetical protein [Burkholderia sp. Tr-860]NIF65033.1 hypothetical protein [Burkholderia sp. Cy-647]NIF72484.1 hypothetical protein [Burkholderia sp. Ap-962]NIF97530.1 hypothetical protein [Burkholderia sp. Ax-1720]